MATASLYVAPDPPWRFPVLPGPGRPRHVTGRPEGARLRAAWVDGGGFRPSPRRGRPGRPVRWAPGAGASRCQGIPAGFGAFPSALRGGRGPTAGPRGRTPPSGAGTGAAAVRPALLPRDARPFGGPRDRQPQGLGALPPHDAAGMRRTASPYPGLPGDGPGGSRRPRRRPLTETSRAGSPIPGPPDAPPAALRPVKPEPGQVHPRPGPGAAGMSGGPATCAGATRRTVLPPYRAFSPP